MIPDLTSSSLYPWCTTVTRQQLDVHILVCAAVVVPSCQSHGLICVVFCVTATAIRQAISKAIVAYYQKYVDEQSKQQIKETLLQYDRTLLVADPRRCEPKK